MKRTVQMVLVAALAAVLATTAASYASGSGSGCSTMACVNLHLRNQNARINALTTHVNHLRARNRALNACLGEYGVSREQNTVYYPYADSDSNPYQPSQNVRFFDALQYYSFTYLTKTPDSETPNQWLLRDTCTPGVFDVKR